MIWDYTNSFTLADLGSNLDLGWRAIEPLDHSVSQWLRSLSSDSARPCSLIFYLAQRVNSTYSHSRPGWLVTDPVLTLLSLKFQLVLPGPLGGSGLTSVFADQF